MSVVDLGVDRHRRGKRGPAHLLGATLEQHAGRLWRMWRHRVRAGPRRIERAGRTGNSHFPIDFRVIRLEVLVRDWPVGESRPLGNSLRAGLLEVDLAKAPIVRGVMDARAADTASVDIGRLNFGLLLISLPKGVRRFGGIACQMVLPPDLDLVVRKIVFVAPGALFEHHDAESRRRQLFRDNATGRAGSDDHEIHFVARAIAHGALLQRRKRGMTVIMHWRRTSRRVPPRRSGRRSRAASNPAC